MARSSMVNTRPLAEIMLVKEGESALERPNSGASCHRRRWGGPTSSSETPLLSAPWRNWFHSSVPAGIGFTVALFINGLAFEGSDLEPIKDQATIGVLFASLLATIAGFAIIRLTHSNEGATPESDLLASMVDSDADGRPDPVPVAPGAGERG